MDLLQELPKAQELRKYLEEGGQKEIIKRGEDLGAVLAVEGARQIFIGNIMADLVNKMSIALSKERNFVEIPIPTELIGGIDISKFSQVTLPLRDPSTNIKASILENIMNQLKELGYNTRIKKSEHDETGYKKGLFSLEIILTI